MSLSLSFKSYSLSSLKIYCSLSGDGWILVLFRFLLKSDTSWFPGKLLVPVVLFGVKVEPGVLSYNLLITLSLYYSALLYIWELSKSTSFLFFSSTTLIVFSRSLTVFNSSEFDYDDLEIMLLSEAISSCLAFTVLLKFSHS